MNRLITCLGISLALASGCAHRQPTNRQVARTTLKVAAVVGLVLLAVGANAHAGQEPSR